VRVDAPDDAWLERRLKARAREDESTIQKRLDFARAEWEVAKPGFADPPPEADAETAAEAAEARGNRGFGEVPRRASGGRRGRAVLPVQGAVRGALAGGAQPAAGSAVVHPRLLGRDPGERDGDAEDQARRRRRAPTSWRRATACAASRGSFRRCSRSPRSSPPSRRARNFPARTTRKKRRRRRRREPARTRTRADAADSNDGADSNASAASAASAATGQARAPLERDRDGAPDSRGVRCCVGGVRVRLGDAVRARRGYVQVRHHKGVSGEGGERREAGAREFAERRGAGRVRRVLRRERNRRRARGRSAHDPVSWARHLRRARDQAQAVADRVGRVRRVGGGGGAGGARRRFRARRVRRRARRRGRARRAFLRRYPRAFVRARVREAAGYHPSRWTRPRRRRRCAARWCCAARRRGGRRRCSSV